MSSILSLDDLFTTKEQKIKLCNLCKKRYSISPEYSTCERCYDNMSKRKRRSCKIDSVLKDVNSKNQLVHELSMLNNPQFPTFSSKSLAVKYDTTERTIYRWKHKVLG